MGAMRLRLSTECYASMVLAMLAMRTVKVTGHQIVDMIPVRNCVVPAVRTVPMRGSVSVTSCFRNRVRGSHLERVLFHSATAHGVVKVSIVQVVDVTIVPYGLMPTIGPVLVSGFRMR
jgi:hypothetical protein